MELKQDHAVIDKIWVNKKILNKKG